MEAQKILHIQDTILGEGPVWDYRSQTLWWIDIMNGRLHEFDPSLNKNKVHNIGQYVGAAVLREEGGLVLALHEGIAFYHPEEEKLEFISRIEEEISENRFNDGKCDPAGRFWAGSTQITHELPVGKLYCIDNKTLTLSSHLEEVQISNGLAWSGDQTKMYFIDTPTLHVKQFAYDKESGQISFERIAITFNESQGFPDGMSIDENDRLWIAFYGGSRVGCYDPDTGKQVEEIKVPAERPTSCAFGGEHFDTLYITSAAKEGDAHGGGLFTIRPGAKGRPVSLF